MSGCARSTLIALSVVRTVVVAQAGERTAPIDPSFAVIGTRSSGQGANKSIRPSISAMLDRIAYAVDGAESSHGKDLTMWRPDPSGPQGPMQVSEPAAADVGGGDRFDPTENRAIGRAYLEHLYRRYKNWRDAIAAYNWGMGNVDSWVKAGRPAGKFVNGVAAYCGVYFTTAVCATAQRRRRFGRRGRRCYRRPSTRGKERWKRENRRPTRSH